MMYPVLSDMNNWLDNDFDDMLHTSWMPRVNVTAPAINVKENDKAYEVEQALTLPDDVEKDKIEAKVDNGVLHITLPRTGKAEKEKKKIEVA